MKAMNLKNQIISIIQKLKNEESSIVKKIMNGKKYEFDSYT